MDKPKTNTAELAKHIGKKAIWHTKSLYFEVIIKDVEVFYGMPYYMISPVAGTGISRVRDDLRILDEQEL